MDFTRKTLLISIAAGALLVVAGVVVFRETRTILDQSDQLSRARLEQDLLRRQLRDLATGIPNTVAPPAAPQPSAGRTRNEGTDAALAAADQRTARLRESLADSNTQIEHLEMEIADLRSRIDATNEENHRLSAAVEAGRTNLADANKNLDAVRSDLKVYTSRVSELENADARAKQDTSASKQSAAQLNQTVSDLEGLFHRRDMYLSDILVRYREITDQYRSISGVMDTRRDRPSSAVSSPEISRIQNAIALADEDLKQVHVLSAQAQRLEKKLTAK